MITEKNTGVKKIPNSVTPIMPLKTAVPSACRISEPAPNAFTNGQTPMLNANDVIRMGRNRNRAASTAASRRFTPLHPGLHLLLGVFHDQDRVLAGQAN